MKIHDALRAEGYCFEYERNRGEDRIEVWINREAKMAVRMEWLKIEGDTVTSREGSGSAASPRGGQPTGRGTLRATQTLYRKPFPLRGRQA